MYKAITFDATGTLFKVRGSIASNYSKVFSQHGIKLNHDIDKNFLKHFSELSKQYPSYGFSKDINNDGIYKNENHLIKKNAFLWWNKLMKDLLKSSSNLTNDEINKIPIETFKDLYNKFGEQQSSSINKGEHEFWEIYNDVLPVLNKINQFNKKQVKQQDRIILSIISNFDERLLSILKQLEIENYFQTIVTSIDCGYQKPNPIIFQQSYDKLLKINSNLKKDQIIYVGDDIKKDCIGSDDFGFTPCFINRKSDTITNNQIIESFEKNNLKVPLNLKIINSFYQLLPLINIK